MKQWPNSKPMQRGPIRRPPTLLWMRILVNLPPKLVMALVMVITPVMAAVNPAAVMDLQSSSVLGTSVEATLVETLEDLAEVDYEWI